jgi:cation transport ATPase
MIGGRELPGQDAVFLLLSAPVVFGFGWPTCSLALKAARSGHANMDSLIALQTPRVMEYFVTGKNPLDGSGRAHFAGDHQLARRIDL